MYYIFILWFMQSNALLCLSWKRVGGPVFSPVQLFELNHCRVSLHTFQNFTLTSDGQKDPLNSETLQFCTYKVSTSPWDQPLLQPEHTDAGEQFSEGIICNKGTQHIYWQLSLDSRAESRHSKLHTDTLSSAQQAHRAWLPAPPASRAGCHDGKPSSATGPSLQLWLQLWKKQTKTSQYQDPQSP